VVSAIKQTTSVASLPAVNRPKTATTPAKSPASDQLLALAKYSSRLAKIDVPYMMGVGVNRKGPSSYANMKDKSDRATNEQVLDPRTRIILFKMIGRGLIHEVNGCVSAGKEVRISLVIAYRSGHLTFLCSALNGRRFSLGQCLSRSDARVRASGAQNLQDFDPSFQGSR
jgi:RIO kinase 1